MFLEGYGYLIFQGAWLTVQVAAWAACVAIVLGLLGALAKLSPVAPLRLVAMVYTTLVRSVPDLVLMLLIYYSAQIGLNQVADALGRESWQLNPYGTAIGTLGFIYGAYCAETFRGAYMTIPRGQIEAARALGLRRIVILWKVTLPQLVRFAIAGYANVWQVLIKSTAVVSVISLQDLVGLANDAGKSVREPFTFFAAVFVIYLLFTFVSQSIFNWAERRYTIKGRNDAA